MSSTTGLTQRHVDQKGGNKGNTFSAKPSSTSTSAPLSSPSLSGSGSTAATAVPPPLLLTLPGVLIFLFGSLVAFTISALLVFLPSSLPEPPPSLSSHPSLPDAEVFDDFKLTSDHVLQYQRDGHLLLKGVVKKQMTKTFLREFEAARKLREQAFYKYAFEERMHCPELLAPPGQYNVMEDLLRCEALYPDNPRVVPYIQFIHMHRINAEVAKFALHPKFGAIAAQLMQVDGVRLYMCAAFFKRAGKRGLLNQATSWHADLNMVPIDTNAFITMWCPLKRVTRESSVLSFASKSHRDIAQRHWFNKTYTDKAAYGRWVHERYKVVEYEMLDVGDCTFHDGWNIHSATGNDSDQDREVVALSFVDADALTLDFNDTPVKGEDELLWRDWLREAEDNHRSLDHPLVPLVYRQSADKQREKADQKLREFHRSMQKDGATQRGS